MVFAGHTTRRPGILSTRLAATAMYDSDLVRLDTHTLRISSTSASSIPVRRFRSLKINRPAAAPHMLTNEALGLASK
jgi:hypothetical protein